MGAAMYGETAAGYGRPRLLAYSRPRTNYIQKIWPAVASANMCRIKCHALLHWVNTPFTVSAPYYRFCTIMVVLQRCN